LKKQRILQRDFVSACKPTGLILFPCPIVIGRFLAEHPRVAFCGEGVGLLWAEGKTDAAIRIEQLCNDLGKTHDVDILCAYPLRSFDGEEDAFRSICAEHSAVYSD
jgi:hypothetical protein